MGLRKAPIIGWPREIGLAFTAGKSVAGGNGSFSLLLIILSASSGAGRGLFDITCVTDDEKKSSTRYGEVKGSRSMNQHINKGISPSLTAPRV